MADHWAAWPAVVIALVAVVLAAGRVRRTDSSERAVAALIVVFAGLLSGYLGLVAVSGRVL